MAGRQGITKERAVIRQVISKERAVRLTRYIEGKSLKTVMRDEKAGNSVIAVKDKWRSEGVL